LARAYEIVGEPIAVVDVNQSLIFVNSAFEKMDGRSGEELAGRPFGDVFQTEIQPFTTSMVQDTPDQRWEGPAIGVRKNGHEYPAQLTLTCLQGQPDEVIGFVCVTRDLELRGRSSEAATLDRDDDASLAEIGRIISSSPELSDVLSLFATAVSRLVPCDRVVLTTVDPVSEFVTSLHDTGIKIKGRPPGFTGNLSGTFGRVVRSRSSLVIQSANLEELADNYPKFQSNIEAGLKSFMAVPLISGGEVTGGLHIQSAKVNAYSQSDVRVAERVATQISGVVATLKVNAELRREVEERQFLAEIAKIVSSSSDIEEVSAPFAMKVREVIHFDRMVIANVNTANWSLEPAYRWGTDQVPAISGKWVAMAGTRAEKVVTTRSALLSQSENINELLSEYPSLSRQVEAGFRSFLDVPLVAGDSVVGLLLLRSHATGAYSQRDVALTERIADQIGGIVANAQISAERERTRLALQETELRFRTLVENATDGIVVLQDGETVYRNPTYENLIGATVEETAGLDPMEFVAPEARERVREIFRAFNETGHSALVQFEMDLITRSNNRVSMEVNPCVIEYKNRQAVMLVMRDITHRKILEDQLMHSQKMEAVGRLAGGVAHDFNNLLTAIIGYSYLGAVRAPAETNLHRYFNDIQVAGERAKNLIRQLLTFSRKQVSQPEVLMINDAIADIDRMLRRLIGENIEMVTLLGPEVGAVRIDPTQLEQLMVNLAVNARDAMPEGGRLVIKTTRTYAGNAGRIPNSETFKGPHIVITVQDTGSGMPDEVKGRIFEPFFTTKQIGEGTGLGLSTCYGIVTQADGLIDVESNVGKGTSFHVYLPEVTQLPEASLANAERDTIKYQASGAEAILIVEDEKLVRDVCTTTLQEQGYSVITASNGTEALRQIESDTESKIDLLITDVVMPLMGGLELVEALSASHPSLKVLFTSGYIDDDSSTPDLTRKSHRFIEKPFTPAAFAAIVRDMLDE
jgi:PAS domain S-box-containing protein